MSEDTVIDGKTTLAEAVKYLIYTIKARADVDVIYKATLKTVNSSEVGIAFNQAKADRINANTVQSEADSEVRRLALEIHAELGETKPASGIQVIDKSTFEILDFSAAVAWCEENLPIAVVKTVDRTLVEVAIERMPEDKRPDFVKFETVQAVRISKGKLGKVEVEEIETEGAPF